MKIVCKCAESRQALTEGEMYEVIDSDINAFLILDDNRNKNWYIRQRFEIIEGVHEDGD